MSNSMYGTVVEKAHQDVLASVAITLTAISTLVVGLRCVTRAAIVRSFGADDWMMLAAAVFAVVMLTQILISIYIYHLGFGFAQLSVQDLMNNTKMTVAIVVVYYTLLSLVKVSILMFYLRIGGVHRWFRISSKVTIALIVTFQLVTTIVSCTQCVPLYKAWTITRVVEGKCINGMVFYHFASIFHIVTDLWILALPLRLIIHIQCPNRDKVGLLFVFGLGILSTASSVLRLQFLRGFILSKDPFQSGIQIHLWSSVEVNAGILCASFPTLKPLLSPSKTARTQSIESLANAPKNPPQRRKMDIDEDLLLTETFSGLDSIVEGVVTRGKVATKNEIDNFK